MKHVTYQLQGDLAAWPGIESHPHRYGGIEWRLGAAEVGHLHWQGMLDIPFPKPLRNALIDAGWAHPHHLLKDSGWISFWIRNEEDAARAGQLLRLSYLRYRIKSAPAAAREELAAMNPPEAVKAAVERHAPVH
jgi:hypothetical protein